MSIKEENLNQTKPLKINEIAKLLKLKDEDIELYGKYKAKLSLNKINNLQKTYEKGKLILVTAMTPTPAGEGKSTVSIGLADALNRGEKTACLSLREPSLGPCFGVKGGATGGGQAQVIPCDEINLNFTGDFNAITNANNLLCAMIDNHIKHGNKLDIQKVYFRRCMDLNDRALREITICEDKTSKEHTRKDGFNITAASEIMAILCLSEDLFDIKMNLGNIVIGENSKEEPVYARELKAVGAMTAILRDAFLPNLVQTKEHTPAFIHGGPFANIAHGTSSIVATRNALRLADYVVTEAGFGADLGAEKFFDLFSKKSALYPDAVVIVATLRALKLHGGVKFIHKENINGIKRGFANLKAHIANIKKLGCNPIVAINRFETDTDNELELVKELCKENLIDAVVVDPWANGSKGCQELADTVERYIGLGLNYNFAPCSLYEKKTPLKDKISIITHDIYGAKFVDFREQASKDLDKFAKWGFDELSVCIAKTPNSISHNKNLLGAPENYVFPISEVRLCAGAGFVVALSGDISTMPGLPAKPLAENIDVDEETGEITGLC